MNEKVSMLKEKAKELRKTALTMIFEAQSGHPGGSLSSADIVTALYFSEMHVDPKNPQWPDRDRFVLSKGHVCPIQYAALGSLGFFPEEVLHTLRQEGSMLQGHPSMLKCPGIDISTGSLGQGASCAVGMALAGKRDHKDYRVFTLLGDGEMDEGIVWEAMMSANRYQLDNFVIIVDNNGLQLDGPCDQIMPHIDLSAKAAAFALRSMISTDTTCSRYLTLSIKYAQPKTASPNSSMQKPLRARALISWKIRFRGTARLPMPSSMPTQ